MRPALLVIFIACGGAKPVSSPAPAWSPPAAPLQRDGSAAIECTTPGTRVALPSDVMARARIGDDALEFAEDGRALIAEAGDTADLLAAVLADWKRLFALAAPPLPTTTVVDGELHATTFAANAMRITGDFAAAGERYRLTALVVVRNGGSCRVQSLVRAGSAALTLDEVRDMPALDSSHPQPGSSPDWVGLVRGLGEAFTSRGPIAR